MTSIWIINYYAATPNDTGNMRHYEFAKHLQLAGYNVRVFSAGFLKYKGLELVPENVKFVNKEYLGVQYTHIKVRHYEGNGLGRMFSIFQFAYRLFMLKSYFDRPKIILHNIHAPFDYPIIWISKYYRAKYIAEAWDLWPQDFVTFGLISSKNLFLKFAFFVERKMYETAYAVIFSFEGGIDYLREKKWTIDTGGKIDPKKVHYINNGLSLSAFYENINKYPSNDPDVNNTDKFKVVYIGSIRKVNNIRQLICAAEILAKDPRYIFLIYGGGEDKPYLQRYCIAKGLNNVIFKTDWMPYHDVAYIVSHASLNIMNYKRGFGEYGVSSGKMFQYFAAGRPILCNIKLKYSDIERDDIGIDANLDNPEEYAAAIKCIANASFERYNGMCNRAKEVAKKFDYDFLSKQLLQVIKD